MGNQGKDIDFRPITPGLGFHPFSDGLPYAPVSKTVLPGVKPQPAPAPKTEPSARPQASGAVAAGQPSFSYPRVSVPVASPRVPDRPVAQASRAAAQAEKPRPFAEPRFGIVYLFKRSLAYLVDTTLNISLLATGLSFALLGEDMGPEQLMNPAVIGVAALFFVLFNWALITAQEIAFGTSVGKRIFGLSIQGSVSALLLRSCFFLPSLGFCGLGLLWALVDSRRRCWHDLVLGVQPIEVARL